jgi:hypothetical protein
MKVRKHYEKVRAHNEKLLRLVEEGVLVIVGDGRTKEETVRLMKEGVLVIVGASDNKVISN